MEYLNSIFIGIKHTFETGQVDKFYCLLDIFNQYYYETPESLKLKKLLFSITHLDAIENIKSNDTLIPKHKIIYYTPSEGSLLLYNMIKEYKGNWDYSKSLYLERISTIWRKEFLHIAFQRGDINMLSDVLYFKKESFQCQSLSV